VADSTCSSTAEEGDEGSAGVDIPVLDVMLLKIDLGLLAGGLGLLVGGLGQLVGGLGLAKPDGGGLLVGPGRHLSMCCVSEALVTGRMKTAKPAMGEPAETVALLFCFMPLSDPETRQQHKFVHTKRAMKRKKKS